MKDVTALVLFCCTENLITPSIVSFRSFYPKMKLLIVDNSGNDRPECPRCTVALKLYVEKDPNAELIILPKNLGHGIGMHCGLKEIKTKYVYVFESDTVMQQPGLIEEMLKLAKPSMYSIGPSILIDYQEGKFRQNMSPGVIRRLWPYSCLLSIKTYFKFPPWDSHNGCNASPLLSAMRKIYDSGKEKELMIEFDVDKYVKHLGGGTRSKIGIPRLGDYQKWTSHYLKSS